MHRRHNPDKSCLETYVLTFCYYGMLSLVKKYKKTWVKRRRFHRLRTSK